MPPGPSDEVPGAVRATWVQHGTPTCAEISRAADPAIGMTLGEPLYTIDAV